MATGQLPLRVQSVEFLGDVRSKNTHVDRDLGWPGRIGKHVFLTYGDTLWTNAKHNAGFMGMTSDSIALATADPCVVDDITVQSNGFPSQWCPIMKEYGEEMAIDSMGITSVIETHPGEGIVFFAKNHRPGGNNQMIGCGVAVVTVEGANTDRPRPVCRRLSKYWWDAETEPWWGDVCAMRAGVHIYAYGHAKGTPYVYVARVHYTQATNLNAYEYWNGSDWQSERLRNVGEKEGIFWQIQQGQMIYSNWYRCYVFLFSDNFWNSKVQAKVSFQPTGPFSEGVDVYHGPPIQEGGTIYSPAAHEYYDESGKTLVITFTNHPNVIQAIRVTWV